MSKRYKPVTNAEGCVVVLVSRAAKMLNVSKVTARKLLGKPYSVERTENGKVRFWYLECKVKSIIEERKCAMCNKENKGKHKCRSCPHLFTKEELVSGKCPDCRAYDLLRNFACHGDCFKCPVPDCNMIKKLENALSVLRLKYQNI